MLAHDCASSACWHYGNKEAFVLRARQFIKKGDEITISYVGDDDLYKSTNGNRYYECFMLINCSFHVLLIRMLSVRQDKLAGWLFKCVCSRCASKTDLSRGFRCPSCGAGVVFFKTDREPQTNSVGTTTASPCSL